jgi:hypothetical protein
MTIRHGELTIIYPTVTNIFTDVYLWLIDFETPPTNSKYIFMFDDEEVCEYNTDTCTDFKFEFLNGIINNKPLHFKKTINKTDEGLNTYFKKEPKETPDGKLQLGFKNLFDSYSKYNNTMVIPSVYNLIYYCYKSILKLEIFGIVRINSNKYMPRFQFAYDSDEFTKEEIMYLIHYIFNM